jgi:capsular exopolysaccharide synthesis family protein
MVKVGVRNYLRVIVWYWYVVIAGLLLGLILAGALTSEMPPSYASEVTMMLAPQQTSGDSAYEGIQLAMEKVKSYTPLLTSEQLAGDVVKRLGLGLNPVELAAHTAVSLQPDTVLITARVTDGSPERAQRIADALSQSFIALVNGLERPIDPASRPSLAVRVVQPATFSDVSVSPVLVVNLALGGIVGLLAGLGGALALNAARMPIRSVRDLTDATGCTVLGVVGADRGDDTEPLAVVDQPGGRRAEAYRRITHLTGLETGTGQGKVVAVVSLAHGDGRTVTACNLAVVLARTQRTVVLVDCDLRHATVPGVLGMNRAGENSTVGLSDVLEDRAKLESALRPWGREGFLDVLAGGPLPSNPGELVASERMQRLLAELAGKYDVVVLDTPPLAPVSDAVALSRLCAGVIVVVQRGKTGRRELRGALETFHMVSASVIGTILNVVPRWTIPVAPQERAKPGLAQPGTRIIVVPTPVDPELSPDPLNDRPAEENSDARAERA